MNSSVEWTVALNQQANGQLPNEVTIRMEVIGIEGVNEEAIKDERGNYVFNQITVKFRLIFSPAMVSYKQNGIAIQAQAGQFPAITEQSLIFYLQQRGRLTWMVGDEVQLSTPLAGRSVDSNNGPFPEVLTIQEMHGARTYEILWQITTFLNQSFKAKPNPPVLLSNVWDCVESLQENYLAVRQYSGRARFDPSRFPAGMTPDSYRDWVLPPAMRGWKRMVNVTATSDGTQLLWGITDLEQRVKLEIPNITRVEVQVGGDRLVPSVVTQVSGVASAVGGLTGAAVSAGNRAKEKGKGLRGLIPEVPGLGQAALGFATSLGGANWLPMNTHHVTVRVFGTKQANIFLLTTVASQIANFHLRFAAINTNGPYTTSALHVLQDITHGMVEIRRIVSVPPAQTGILGTDQNTLFMNFMKSNNDGFEANSDYDAFANNPATIPQRAVGSSVPPRRTTNAGVHSRGYANAKIFAQVLQNPGAAPVAPPLPTQPESPANPNS